MAADGVSSVDFSLIHGKKKYELTVTLAAEEGGDVLTVGHIQRLVARETGIPPNKQRLILKGVQLSNPLDKLSKFDAFKGQLKEKPKLLLIGEKPPSENDALKLQIAALNEEVDKHDKRMSEMSAELDSANRGFLNDSQLSTMLQDMKRRLRNEHVAFDRLFERIDGVTIAESGDDQEVFARTARKQLAVRVQQLDERAQQFETTLTELLTLISKRKK